MPPKKQDPPAGQTTTITKRPLSTSDNAADSNTPKKKAKTTAPTSSSEAVAKFPKSSTKAVAASTKAKNGPAAKPKPKPKQKPAAMGQQAGHSTMTTTTTVTTTTVTSMGVAPAPVEKAVARKNMQKPEAVKPTSDVSKVTKSTPNKPKVAKPAAKKSKPEQSKTGKANEDKSKLQKPKEEKSTVKKSKAVEPKLSKSQKTLLPTSGLTTAQAASGKPTGSNKPGTSSSNAPEGAAAPDRGIQTMIGTVPPRSRPTAGRGKPVFPRGLGRTVPGYSPTPGAQTARRGAFAASASRGGYTMDRNSFQGPSDHMTGSNNYRVKHETEEDFDEDGQYSEYSSSNQQYSDDNEQYPRDNEKYSNKVEEKEDEIKAKDNKQDTGPDYKSLTGVYTVDCPTISQQWPHDMPPEGLNLRLLYSARTRTLWGAYDFGMFGGYLRALDLTSRRVGESYHMKAQFEWRVRENGEGEMSFGSSCRGWLLVTGSGILTGEFQELVGSLVAFQGRRKNKSRAAVGKGEVDFIRDFEAINEMAYEEERRNRW